MNYKVGIIGIGNLGIRHLQALMKSDLLLDISVVDINQENIRRAKEMCEQSKSKLCNRVEYYSNINDIDGIYDLFIIATTSAIRRKVTEELIENIEVKYLILEKTLFQKIEDYNIMEQLFKKKGIKVWVNCPRRMYPFYKKLREECAKIESFELMESGYNWGMGCCIVHTLDLIAFLGGYENIKINIEHLDNMYEESKRKGYLEITGTISGSMGKCKNFSITSYVKGNAPESLVICSEKFKYFIDEASRTFLVMNEETNWEWKKEELILPYQSELTHIAVRDILTIENCELSDYKTAMLIHEEMQKPLCEYFKQLGVEDDLCPIT